MKKNQPFVRRDILPEELLENNVKKPNKKAAMILRTPGTKLFNVVQEPSLEGACEEQSRHYF